MRSHYCGDIQSSDIGAEVEISGWVHKRRDHGGVIFLDIRDLHGIVQVVFNPESKDTFDLADSCRSEFVINIKGSVRSNHHQHITAKRRQISELGFYTSRKIVSLHANHLEIRRTASPF